MTLGYNKASALSVLAAGLGLIAVGIAGLSAASSWGDFVGLGPGLLLLWMGWRMLYRPRYEVTETALIAHALIGARKRSAGRYGSRGDLMIENDCLYVDGVPTLKKAQCDDDDWKKLARQLRDLAAR
jgi:hypothetical protein